MSVILENKIIYLNFLDFSKIDNWMSADFAPMAGKKSKNRQNMKQKQIFSMF